MGIQKDDKPDAVAPRDVRCFCGRLLARLVAEGVELLCPRCKRHKIVPLSDDASFEGDGEENS
jgi:hypothetical protein